MNDMRDKFERFVELYNDPNVTAAVLRDAMADYLAVCIASRTPERWAAQQIVDGQRRAQHA